MSLLPILALLVVFSLSLQYVLYRSDGANDTVSGLIWRKQTFHVAEGLRNVSVPLLQDYVGHNPTATNVEVQTALQSQLQALVPEGYQLAPLQVAITAQEPTATIPNGPFAGMNASLQKINLSVAVTKDSVAAPAYSAVDANVMLGQISMFQFLFFANVDRTQISFGPNVYYTTRIHSNGSWCLGGSLGTHFGKVTAAEKILSDGDSVTCNSSTSTNARIYRDASLTTWARLGPSNDHGCSNCENTGLDWPEYALMKWGGNALDKAHGVAPLYPLAAEGASIQRGYDNTATIAPAEHPHSFRFLVDPVLASDPETVRTQKFAHQADIRILNGIWYLKNPADENQWPGIPIWSDHPGNATIQIDGIAAPQVVGQDDLRSARGWATTPRYFSYYEYDNATGALLDNAEGVISYGTLFHTGVEPVSHVPGHLVASDIPSRSHLCRAGKLNCPAAPASCNMLNALELLTCDGGGVQPNRSAFLLNAARSGYRDPHIFETFPGTAAERDGFSKILPINFDMNAFQAALAQTGSGELGSYFGATGLMGRPFNGIVYISSFWPGSQTGYGSDVPPPMYPPQGAIADPRQAQATHPSLQRALPQFLCSDGVGGNVDAGFDRADANRNFAVPRCSDYAPASPSGYLAYPSAIRVINGSNLNGAVLTKGISLVSNLPVGIVGNYNLNSDTTNATATPWVASLIAGDSVKVYSRNYSDGVMHWSLNLAHSYRPALDTSWTTAILNGNESLTYSEWWTHPTTSVSSNATYRGSWVQGFYKIYDRSRNQYFSGAPNRTYVPPARLYNYDPHLHSITNQPPGAPFLPVSAITNWKRN